MGARHAPPGQSFHLERKWRLLLGGSRPPVQHPPLHSISCRSDGRGRRSDAGAFGAVPVHAGISDSLRCNYSPSEETSHAMKAVFVEQTGGPENLKYADIPKPSPAAGQALVKIAASGVNFIDVYFRTGLYPAPAPIVLGHESAGTVEAVGPDVTNIRPGDRVAYAMARGSYAEYAVVPAWQLVKIPPTVDFNTAAAAMLQGMTAHYLTP